ncbi:MAG: hypothetical protein IPJ39_19715 [Saprospiraceae bacterium]|nr:hypothetical protein [Saprospiraceae bacterium]
MFELHPDPKYCHPLNYTNGVTDPTGVCQIVGNDVPTRTGDLVNCEGVYTYTGNLRINATERNPHTEYYHSSASQRPHLSIHPQM